MAGTVASPRTTARALSQRRQPVAIDQHLLRPVAQAQHGAAHRQKRRLQNIQRVDLFAIGPGHRPSQCRGAYLTGQLLARGFGQLFGISQTLQRTLRIEDDRCRIHRSGKRSPPGLIDTGHAGRHQGPKPRARSNPATACAARRAPSWRNWI